MKQRTWKKTAAFALALTLVAGAVHANTWTGGLFSDTAITAYADDTMVGQFIRTPGRGGSATMTFSGASNENPIWYNKRVEKRCVQSIAKLLFFYYNKGEKVRRNSDRINTSVR